MATGKYIDRIGNFAKSIPEGAVLYVALFAIAAIIFLRAWVAEDAYITFRVIENFMNGYGLRWNTHDRVQVYTHPLWLLLQIPLFAIWNNIFHVSIILSIICSMSAIMIALFATKKPIYIRIVFFLLPLALSKSFIDYTTSGLETPLCYLTFVGFGYVVTKLRQHNYFWFYLSLSVALAMLNRLDSILIYAPALLWFVSNNKYNISWRQVILGATPLIAWLYFSIFYYGFIFPNTKYAKLDTGLELAQYLQQSFNYVKYLIILDTPGFIILCSSLWFVFKSENIARYIALGVYSYFLYVLYIGGDYMAGRFWAFPIFVSVWLWYMFAPERMRWDAVFAVFCAIISAYAVSPMLKDINKNCSECIELKGRIMDATRTFWLNKLIVSTYPLKMRSQGNYPFCRDGKKLANKKPPVEVMFYVGMHAYCAGPKLQAIDMLGLGDALISRLPATKKRGFYIGHFRRDIPEGYSYAVASGNTNMMDPSLAKYYEKLRLITSGDLFDRERLKTIVLFNLGYYDEWKYEYLKK